MSGEFDKLTDLELLSLINRAEQEIQHRKQAGKDHLRAEIEEKIQSLGFNLEDVFPELSKKLRKTPVARMADGERKLPRAKYKNPRSGETWSGRGNRPPQWVKDAMRERGWDNLDKFKTAEEFLAQD